MKRFSSKLFLLFFLFFCFACTQVEEETEKKNEKETDFCSLFEAPQKYEAKALQTTGIVLGYHTFIFYNGRCLANEKVMALAMDYETRRQLGEAIGSQAVNYQTSFLRNNLYAEITVSGKIMENDDKQDAGFTPKYKFFVGKIEKINILSEEIYPSDEARGVKIVNQEWNK